MQGRENILQFSNRNMDLTFGSTQTMSEIFLRVIPAEDIIETKDLKTYTGDHVFFARVKESHGGEFVLASSLSGMIYSRA